VYRHGSPQVGTLTLPNPDPPTQLSSVPLTCDYLVTYSADVVDLPGSDPNSAPISDPNSDMDSVFRALADPSRRRLLDGLRDRDGQTLTQLCGTIPDMTRFGVMKHLGVLEEAHLVVTERHGRSKHHYLNPVPIRLIHDRWISKYAEPFASALTELTALRGA
jgi:DNA-binding transcriptional ArsR family regulator